MSTEPRVYLVAVDERSVPGAGNQQLEIEPGKHRLRVRLVALGINELVDVDIDVKPGVLYGVSAYPDDSKVGWTVRLKARARWKRG